MNRDIENVYAVVKKLIGPINPVGDTTVDDERFENLKQFIDVFEDMLGDIRIVALSNHHRGEYSRKRAGDYCDSFLKKIVKEAGV